MKLYKRDERVLDTNAVLKVMRESGCKTTHVGEWDKWKELEVGGRMQARLDVYEVKNDTVDAYFVSDGLGRVATPMLNDKQEILDWLSAHGYKPDKQWYTEDCGMSEDTWNEWNRE